MGRVLRGEVEAEDGDQLLAAARLGYHQGHYARAVELFEKAFTIEPALAEDMAGQNRYYAAGSAALAAGNQEDEASLNDARRVELRQLAMDWLRADLSFWSQTLESNPEERRRISVGLAHWQRNPHFRAISDPKVLETFPAAEREAWKALWFEAYRLRQRAR